MIWEGDVTVAAWIVLVAGCCITSPATAFIFPDMKALRTGGRVQSRYKIAVIQEEPFLGANGTGYVPDLLRLVADWYADSNDEGDVFPYDIVPVNSWSQLMTTASGSHWQVSFGLIVPSLMRRDEPWRSMHSASLHVHTELKMVAWRMTRNTTTTTKLALPHSPEGVHGSTVNRHDMKKVTLLALDGSPEARIIRKHHKYANQLRVVDNIDEAVEFIQHRPNVFFLKDSAVTNRLEEQFGSDLITKCPKKGLVSDTHMSYGFFGRDSAITRFFNDAFKKLKSSDKFSLKALDSKYFDRLRSCSTHTLQH